MFLWYNYLIYSLEIHDYTKEIKDNVVHIVSSAFDFKLFAAPPLDYKEPLTQKDIPSLSFGTDLLAVGSSYEVNKFVYTPSYFVGEGDTFVRYGHDEKIIEITIPLKMYAFPQSNMKEKIWEIITPYIKSHNKKI